MLLAKRIVLLLLFFSTSILYSQNYQSVDTLVSKYPIRFSSVTKLAKRISNDFKTDAKKVRAVFYWIANNVRYDPRESGKFNYDYGSEAELLRKENIYIDRLSTRVISKRVAVCEGYATLFTEVCKALGIKSKVVSGASKTTFKDIGNRFYSSHAWNVVEINKKLHLVDVTWGAGTYGARFHKELDNSFFLTPPEIFINRHYPENYSDALLKDKISKEHFSNIPLIYESKYELITPLEGIIKKQQKIVNFNFVCTSGTYSVDYNTNLKQNSVGEIKCTDGKLAFDIDLQNHTRAKELTLFFDYKPIITFRLK